MQPRTLRGRLGHALLLVAPLALVACGGASEPVQPKTASPAPPPPTAAPPPAPPAEHLASVDEAALDTSVSACDDFYQYACGGWMKATPIPEDQPAWMRSFDVIRERNEKMLRDVLEADAKQPPADQAYAKQLGDFYASCMDEAAIEKAGLAPVQPELDRLAKVKNVQSLVDEIAHLHLIGVTALFDVGSEQDYKDATQEIGVVVQGGLGLPDRDYYLNDDEASKKLRAEYQAHVERLFALAGDKPAVAKKNAATVMTIETALARASMNKVDRRDPNKTYHRLDRAGLSLVAPAVDWDAYWTALGFPKVTAINVEQPEFLAEVSRMLNAAKKPQLPAQPAPASATPGGGGGTAAAAPAGAPQGATAHAGGPQRAEGPGHPPQGGAHPAAPAPTAKKTPPPRPLTNVPIPQMQTYLRYHVLAAASPRLPQRFVDEDFKFRQLLTGAKTNLPRWKRCVRIIDAGMGEALAQPFVKETLGAEGKAKAQELIGRIEGSMRADLETLSWMDPPTRKRAVDKLALIANKIGYPDVWRSYEGLDVKRGDYLGDVFRANAFESHRQLAKIGNPVDRKEWQMTPPTVNAYYDASMNEMVFPAGILQPPFYSNGATVGTNFGGIGMVMGHELTHGFDDEGRKFDGHGNLVDWWSPQVGAEFDRRAECVAKQYEGYEPQPGLHLNGHLTLGENLADNGGLKLAYAALQERLAEQPKPADGKFTPEQQFFLGYAQAWCGNLRPEYERNLVMTNPHSPPRFRVIGPISNMPEFAKAFSCQPGSKMVRPPADRCEVW